MAITQQIQPRAILTIPEGGTGAANVLDALTNLEVPMGTIEAVQGSSGLTGFADTGVATLGIQSSVMLTGNPTRQTAPPVGDVSNQLATTAFVMANAGAPGGSGTVNVGAAGQLGYYATAGTAISATANVSVAAAGHLVANHGIIVGTPADGGLGVGSINTSGHLQVNLNTNPAATGGVWMTNRAVDTIGADGMPTGLSLIGWPAPGNNVGLDFYRGINTVAASGVVDATTNLGVIFFSGWDGAGFEGGAAIGCVPTQPWVAGSALGTSIFVDTADYDGIPHGIVRVRRLTIGEGVVVGGIGYVSGGVNGDMGWGTVNVPATGGYYIDGTPLTGGVDTVNANLIAAGIDISSAVALPMQLNDVTSGAGGVRWDTPTPGDHRFVHNGTANMIAFYPPNTGGARINDLAAGAAVMIPPDNTAQVRAVSATRLVTVP